MIERFEKIWHRKSGADNEQLCRLNLWLKENYFPVYDLPDTYIELLKESNGGALLREIENINYFLWKK